ncbi:MAG: hypothetical protein IPM21_13190 [Acidobacteria bacterium]|nr:hypothetical protein [Acidobacteriota bacterium]
MERILLLSTAELRPLTIDKFGAIGDGGQVKTTDEAVNVGETRSIEIIYVKTRTI